MVPNAIVDVWVDDLVGAEFVADCAFLPNPAWTIEPCAVGTTVKLMHCWTAAAMFRWWKRTYRVLA